MRPEHRARSPWCGRRAQCESAGGRGYSDDLLSVLTETLVNAYEDNYFRPIKKEELREVLQRNLDFINNRGEEGQHSTRNGNWPTYSKEKNDWSF